VNEVDRAGIQLANLKLGELYRLVDEVSGNCSYKHGGGEDCCAASCDAASRQAASMFPSLAPKTQQGRDEPTDAAPARGVVSRVSERSRLRSVPLPVVR